MGEAINNPSVQEARQLWSEATNFQELCELGALFIEGKLPYSPSCVAEGLDEESALLVRYLADFNRAGFLTDSSQPGGEWSTPDGEVWKQRAFVSGLAMPDVADKLYRVSLVSDVVVLIVRPGETIDLSIPGGQGDGEATLWLGSASRRCGDGFDGVCSPDLVNLIESQALLADLFDPCWGRPDYLWDQIAAALDTA